VLSRIMYEYLFGMITLEDIMGDWLHPRLRDWGHTKRITECYHRAYNRYGGLKCRWIS
jgi:hypothetical protein